MADFPCSFTPLCSTPEGIHASIVHSIPPYVDGSCRREPDFEHHFPCITGLCRPDANGPGSFAGRLQVGDRVVYWTNQHRKARVNHLVSVLEVIQKVDSHVDARRWYEQHELPLPNNLIVRGNHCIPWNKTHQQPRCVEEPDSLKVWDAGYVARAVGHPDVAICQFWNAIRFLHNPPIIDVQHAFGHAIETQNPAEFKGDEWDRFVKWLKSVLKSG